MPTGASGSGSGPRSKVAGPVRRQARRPTETSAQSWSSVATQKTATAGSPAASSAAAQRDAATVLAKAVERSAEEPGLLAGHHHAGGRIGQLAGELGRRSGWP